MLPKMNWKNQNIIFSAPMAGVSERVFRRICRSHGADGVFSEMVSAEGLIRKGKQTLRLLGFDNCERPIGIQLFGSDPQRLADAAAMVEQLARPDFIDLNCGCPVRKVVNRNSGAALLKDAELFRKIINSMIKAISCPLTVKIRSGWNKEKLVDVEYALIAQDHGVAAITVHPRTRSMNYSEPAMWERIAAVKAAVSIPVIGNGDITNALEAIAMFKETCCDAIMIGRGCLGNPWIFSQIKELLSGKQWQIVTPFMKYKVVREHIEMYSKVYGQQKASRDMRKHCAWYVQGLLGASAARNAIFRSKSCEELVAIMEDVFKKQPDYVVSVS